jgi:hypothetical protein
VHAVNAARKDESELAGSDAMTTTIASDARDDYQNMLNALRDNFAALTGPLFETDAEGLWKAWLGALPESERQHHNCHACRRFIEKYLGLVTIDEKGIVHVSFPWMSNDYARSFIAAAKIVESARVTGVHVSSDKIYGLAANTDKKNGCTRHHMHVIPPAAMIFTGKILNASQRAAELRADRATLSNALAEFKSETVKQALAIAEAESLYRGEKIEDRLRWLVELHERRAATANMRTKENLTWLAVATAPVGYCHIKSSVVGSLLGDIEAGKPFAEVKRAFNAKMHPLQYQRPTAPPSEGNIKQAEALVEKLGIAPSLRRRYARLEDVIAHAVWTPREAEIEKKGGVFNHLRDQPKGALVVVQGATMTWDKFARTVLTTAELAAGTRVKVTAIVPMPNQWQPGFDHHGNGVLLILDGCRDTRDVALSLFPEFLKSELHAVRSTIEAHSRKGVIEGKEQASACGIPVRAGSSANVRVRVTSRGTLTDYTIDRWD